MSSTRNFHHNGDDEYYGNEFIDMQAELAKSVQVGIPSITDEDGNKISAAMDSAANGNSAKNMFSIGSQQIPPKLFSWYASQGFVGYQACAIMSQQWLVSKACSHNGEKALSKWFDMSIDDGNNVDGKVISYIKERNKETSIRSSLLKAHYFNNVFGIRHVLFKVDSDDDDYYLKPFNIDAVKSGTYKGMAQIDPYWITPNLTSEEVSDPTSLDFYDPEHWVVNGNKYHRSHFVILRGEEVPDFLKPSYLYGGIPLVQRIYERCYAAERTANEAPLLTLTKRLNVYKVEDAAKVVANPSLLSKTMNFLTKCRDNFGVLVASNKEDVQQLETSLADLDTTITSQYSLVAAAIGAPVSEFMGTPPRGFNATGDSEIKSYHELLDSIQTNQFAPIIERHISLLVKSEVVDKFGVNPKININWTPQAQETRKEQAEINEINSRTIKTLVVDVGAIDNYEARDRLISDELSGFSGLESMSDTYAKED